MDVNLRFDVSLDSEEPRRIAEQFERFGAENGLPERMIFGFQLALDEILTNVISYGFEEGAQDPVITVTVVAKQTVIPYRHPADGTSVRVQQQLCTIEPVPFIWRPGTMDTVSISLPWPYPWHIHMPYIPGASVHIYCTFQGMLFIKQDQLHTISVCTKNGEIHPVLIKICS